MKKYHKVGNRPGCPAYRTPAKFRYQKYLKTAKQKSSRVNRLDSPLNSDIIKP